MYVLLRPYLGVDIALEYLTIFVSQQKEKFDPSQVLKNQKKIEEKIKY